MRKIILMSLVVLIALAAQAQRPDNPRVKEMRKEFYKKELQFTAQEENDFWRIYDEYKAEEEKLNEQFNSDAKIELMNDDQARAHILEMLDMEAEKAVLKRKYTERLMEVLPVRKVAMVPRTERKFKRQLLNKVKDRRRDRMRKRN